MIPQKFIEEVQSRTDIVEVISEYVALKKSGRNFKGLCPFHGEKTPSFMVSPQKQIFHCFGCSEGGGVFQFLSLIEKVNFPEAVEMLAKRLGLEMPYQKGPRVKNKETFYKVLQEAAVFYHKILKENLRCRQVVEYLKSRGIARETMDTFLLGYAPGGNSLIQHLRKSGFTLEEMEKVALVRGAKDGFKDLFSDRVTFPVLDVRSRVVGFGARLWKNIPDSPKYINSLENVVYAKRANLFGLNFSKDEIIRKGSAIVVEGYLDMIVPFMRGVKNITASLGTALTVEQIRLLKRYTSSVVLMYDSDSAGRNAALRSIDLLLENGLKAEVACVPSGHDPDSLAFKKGKEAFSKVIDESRDFFTYKLEALKQTHDSTSIEGKTKIAKDMLTTIDKLQSEIEKYEYIKKLSQALGIKEEIAIAEFRSFFPKDNRLAQRKASRSDSGAPVSRLSQEIFVPFTEKILLKCMLTNPKAFLIVKKNLREEHFTSVLVRKTIAFLFKLKFEEEIASPQSFLGLIDDKSISGFVSKILMDDDVPLDKNVFKESILKLCKKAALEEKKTLQEKIRLAEKEGDNERVKELLSEYSRL
jgi:DNA primase